jgi:undecaprenyl-diphosphatase
VADGEARPSPDGAGVRFVVNPASGPVWTKAATEDIRAALPAADVIELEDGSDLADLLCDPSATTLGAAGGDGTLGAAAVVAADRDVPLIAVPGGTLNHLARDLGIGSVDDAIAGVRAGLVARIDLGTVADRCFVNTLTFGGYSAVVDTRERYERRLGKWPALVIALLLELPRMEPCHLELDGEPVEVWLGWIGNCVYGPTGLAPVWRARLDDGLLDVRLIHSEHRLARTRVVLAAMLGRLSALSAYSERQAESLHVVSLDGPLRLAADGETFDAPAELTIAKRRRALQVVLPPAPASGGG